MRNFQVGFFGQVQGMRVGKSGHWAAQLLPQASHTALTGSASSRDPGSSTGLPKRLGNLTSHPLRCQQAEALLQCSRVVTKTPFFLME